MAMLLVQAAELRVGHGQFLTVPVFHRVRPPCLFFWIEESAGERVTFQV
jgi:hypothetical protein